MFKVSPVSVILFTSTLVDVETPEMYVSTGLVRETGLLRGVDDFPHSFEYGDEPQEDSHGYPRVTREYSFL